jgi:hypothetical protein
MTFIKVIRSNAIWIICVLSFLSALLYNQINLNYIPDNQLRENETIITNDDVSYIVPPKNYLKTGTWKANSIGKQSYFIRPPGYGIFYLIFIKIADYPLALKLLKVTQLLLFSCSVYWLYFIGFTLLKNKTIALLGSALYGLAPFTIGFLYYTLTEGITPALLLLYIFLLLKAHTKKSKKTKSIFYFLASISFAYLVIVRPQLSFFVALIPLFIINDYWSLSIKKMATQIVVFIIIGFSFWGAWQYRNYKITNQILPIHPIYYSDGNSFFRPTLKAYWNFVGSWAQEGETAYSYMVPLWENAINGDTSIVYIQKALNTFPDKVIAHFGRSRLTQVFRNYQTTVLYQKPYYEKRMPMPEVLSEIERKTINEFNQLTVEYKNEFWFDYHIRSPLKVFKKMAFHSNLSLYVFQHTYRGNWLMEVVRWLFFIIHSICFVLLIFNLFYFKKSSILSYGINFIVFIYVFYLCYFQRGIEERYTLPILPLLIIGALLFFNKIPFITNRLLNSTTTQSEELRRNSSN